MFFTPLGYCVGVGGSPKGLVHKLPIQFFTLGSSKIEGSENHFFWIPLSPQMTIKACFSPYFCSFLGLETMVMWAVWGATGPSHAKEVAFVVLSPGHRISLLIHIGYQRVLWMARVARTPVLVQVLGRPFAERPLPPMPGATEPPRPV